MFDKIVLLRIIKCKVYTLLWNILFAEIETLLNMNIAV